MNIMKPKQLKLTKKELEIIGFNEVFYEKTDETEKWSIFKIETINGYFYYNPTEKIYTWYHKTILVVNIAVNSTAIRTGEVNVCKVNEAVFCL